MQHSFDQTPRVLPAKEYVTEAIKHIRAASTRVVLFAMIITHDETTDELIDALSAAATRGVKVRVAADIVTFSVLHGETKGAFWRNRGIKATRRMRERLMASGVEFLWVGDLGPLVYAQRTHVKWCIVDDMVFSFGGVNLYKNGIRNIDYMIQLHDDALADHLDTEHLRIHRLGSSGNRYPNHRFVCKTGDVLIDGGKFGKSLIYQRACALANKASSVTLVSQYPPSGRLAGILRQKEAALYFNNWHLSHGANRILLMFRSVISRQPNSYVRRGYLHAKLMLFTMPDGKKVALSGSHNFIRGGVWLGTREIALETHDPALIAQLETYVQQHIA